MCAMSVTHHGRAATLGAEARPVSPPARRVSRQRWQDPRLWVGLLLVAASVVIGARLLAAADDTVPVWRLTSDIQAGAEVSPTDVEVAHVHFDESSAAAAYLAADGPLPEGLRAEHPLTDGELLAESAVGTEDVAVPRQLPLGVTAAGVPTGLGTGDVVDVWAVPPPDAEGAAGGGSTRVLQEVTVAGMSDAGPSGIASDQQVLVAISDDVDLATVLDQLAGSTVVLVRVDG
jgi:hypothetical protein